jgi:hypothetical protein
MPELSDTESGSGAAGTRDDTRALPYAGAKCGTVGLDLSLVYGGTRFTGY